MDKILRINMGADGGPNFTQEPLGDYAGLGGRAMTSAIVNNEVPPGCHPLGQHNKLVFSPGLLSGTAAVVSGRLSVGFKSPLTGGIKESNAGGQPSQVLAKLGFAAVVIEGKSADDRLYKIVLSVNGVEILPYDDAKMLGNYDLVKKIKENHGDKVCSISIGPAGEMQMSSASIACTDMEMRPTRHAGRGGGGAVMGSKGVKAIILDDTGTKMRQPKDPDAFNKANKNFASGLKGHPVTSEGLPGFGTNVLTNVINEAGAYPTRNFKEGRFEGISKISGETLVQLETDRGGNPTHACHKGCIIKCSGIFHDKDGNYLTKQPEYETIWAHGGNCGIDDLDIIAQLDRMDDDFGIDTMETGVAIGVAMEAGLAEFGDGKAAIEMVREIGKGSPLGRILGNGAAITGKVFGVEKVPVVKKQAMAAYDPRAVQGQGVTYATSPMGADHTAGYAVATNIMGVGGGVVDPLKADGQVELSRNLQIATASIDSYGMCLFIAFPLLDDPNVFQALIDMLNAMYGLELTGDDLTTLGQSVLKNEREFNAAAGFTSVDDRLPEFFQEDPLSPHDVVFKVQDEDLDSVFNW
jgi:aldehyde:ferredoxin oxidoreductase